MEITERDWSGNLADEIMEEVADQCRRIAVRIILNSGYRTKAFQELINVIVKNA